MEWERKKTNGLKVDNTKYSWAWRIHLPCHRKCARVCTLKLHAFIWFSFMAFRFHRCSAQSRPCCRPSECVCAFVFVLYGCWRWRLFSLVTSIKIMDLGGQKSWSKHTNFMRTLNSCALQNDAAFVFIILSHVISVWARNGTRVPFIHSACSTCSNLWLFFPPFYFSVFLFFWKISQNRPFYIPVILGSKPVAFVSGRAPQMQRKLTKNVERQRLMPAYFVRYRME